MLSAFTSLGVGHWHAERCRASVVAWLEVRAGLRRARANLGAMPPFTCLDRWHASTASHNKLVNTDALRRPVALLPSGASRRLHARYVS
jgi:hypothetical protein